MPPKRRKLDPREKHEKEDAKVGETPPVAHRYSLSALPDIPLDTLLQFSASPLDLRCLSLTSQSMHSSAERCAKSNFCQILSDRTHGPTQHCLCCTMSTPLHASWAWRLERLVSADCTVAGKNELFVFGHMEDTYQDRGKTIATFWRGVDWVLADDGDMVAEDDFERIEISHHRSAIVGASPMPQLRFGFNGPPFGLRLVARAEASLRRRQILCRALLEDLDAATQMDVGVGSSKPLVLDSWEVLLVEGSTVPSPGGNNKWVKEELISNLAASNLIFTFKTCLQDKCWNCDGRIEEGKKACDECIFDEGDDQYGVPKDLIDEMAAFSEYPGVARKLGKEQKKDAKKYPITFFELRSGADLEAKVLGRARVEYSNFDNEFGETAGPTLVGIESLHCNDEKDPKMYHMDMLDYVLRWVHVIFPHPTQLQVEHTVWQFQVPNGENLFKERGFRDSNGEGDFMILIGDVEQHSDDEIYSSDDDDDDA